MSQRLPPGVQLATDEADRLEKLYEQAERDILSALSDGLLRGNDVSYLRTMLSNVQSLLADLRRLSKQWAEQSIPNTYQSGVNVANQQLLEAQISVQSIAFGRVHTQAAQVLADNAFNRLDHVVQLIGRRTEDMYRQLALEATRQSIIGYRTYQQVARQFEKSMVENGITGFRDAAGREWNMTSYARMVARTTTMEAHLAGTANRLLEANQDLVIVSKNGSKHMECAVWEGKVLSLTGKTTGFPTLAEAKAAKLFHPNCRHAYGLYIDLDAEIIRLEERLKH